MDLAEFDAWSSLDSPSDRDFHFVSTGRSGAINMRPRWGRLLCYFCNAINLWPLRGQSSILKGNCRSMHINSLYWFYKTGRMVFFRNNPGGDYMFIENMTHDVCATPAGVVYLKRYGVAINMQPRWGWERGPEIVRYKHLTMMRPIDIQMQIS